jgi:two-component system, LytTR family, sensor kinase
MESTYHCTMNLWFVWFLLIMCTAWCTSSAQVDSVRLCLDSSARAQDVLATTRWINKALDIAARSGDATAQGKSYEALADVQSKERFYPLALKNYSHAIQLIERKAWLPAAENKQRLQYKMALVYYETQDWTLAAINSGEAYALAGSIRDKVRAGRLNAMALCRMGTTSDALARFDEMKTLATANSLPEELARTELEMGNCLTMTGNIDDANSAYGNAMSISNQNGYRLIGRKATQNMASNLKDIGEPAKAAMVYKEALAMNDSVLAAPWKFELGNALLLSNDVEAAEQAINDGLKQLNLSNHEQGDSASAEPSTYLLGATAYRNLADELLRQQQFDKAIRYYQQYAALQDSAYAEQQKQLQVALSLGSALADRQRTIEQLELERKVADQSIQSLTLEKQAQDEKLVARNAVIASLAVAILAISLGVYRVQRTRKEKGKAEKLLLLQSLTGQMNPHFIFNALNSVNDFIAKNDERAANRYLTSFAQLMRRVLDDSKQTFIPLQEEVNMMRLYLELEHARFSEAFDYTLHVDEEALESDLTLPPMLVQPFVENAIWHGLRYRNSKGHLTIEMYLKEGALHISIRDNGIGMERSTKVKTDQQKKQRSMGVTTTLTRVNLINELYATHIQINMQPAHTGQEYPGVWVHIIIPPKSPSAPV